MEIFAALKNLNQTPGEGSAFAHGVAQSRFGEYRLIISQPDYRGGAAGLDFIDEVMSRAGFAAIQDPGTYYRASDGVVVIDLHPVNAIRQGKRFHESGYLEKFKEKMEAGNFPVA